MKSFFAFLQENPYLLLFLVVGVSVWIGRFTIKGTDRQVFWYMQHQYGYCFNVAGENIGTVKWPGASEEEATNWVFDAFMNSQGHRDNIMGKAWDVVAVVNDEGYLNGFLFESSISGRYKREIANALIRRGS